MGSWAHAIGFGLLWVLCVFPFAAGKRPDDSFRKILFGVLLVGSVVGLIDSFGWRALSIPMVFITVPLAATGFYLNWSTKLKALATAKGKRDRDNGVARS
jgi:hypothetical protein